MTDCVGELNLTTCGETGRHDVLRHIAAHVGRRAVDLGRILAGEGASTMAAHAAVGVDDDLPAGEAGVSLRPSDDETSGRVDEELGLLGEHLGGDDLANHLLNDEFPDDFVLHSFGMLGGDDDIDDTGRLAIHILDGDLALRVGAQPLGRTVLAEAGQLTAKAVRVHDRCGHQLRSFIAGVAEHQSLVTGTLLGGLLPLGLLGIDALRDVRALGGDDVVDEDAVGMEHIIVVHVADLADRLPDDLVVIKLGLGRDLAADHHDVALGVGLAGDAAHRILRQTGVKDGVGNGVANFVGMAFAD